MCHSRAGSSSRETKQFKLRSSRFVSGLSFNAIITLPFFRSSSRRYITSCDPGDKRPSQEKRELKNSRCPLFFFCESPLSLLHPDSISPRAAEPPTSIIHASLDWVAVGKNRKSITETNGR